MQNSPACSFEHGGRPNGIEHPAKHDEEKHGDLSTKLRPAPESSSRTCLLYTSDAADE